MSPEPEHDLVTTIILQNRRASVEQLRAALEAENIQTGHFSDEMLASLHRQVTTRIPE